MVSFRLWWGPRSLTRRLWRDLGRDVHINYDDMNRILNEEEGEESSSSSDDDDNNGGSGGSGEEDIPVPQVLIALKRGRRSTSGSGFVVNVRGN